MNRIQDPMWKRSFTMNKVWQFSTGNSFPPMMDLGAKSFAKWGKV